MIYKHRQNCKWEINASAGKVVILTFKDFHLESNSGCSYDYVKLSEKISNGINVIAKLCAKQGAGKTYRSSGSRMIVNFKSDGSNAYKGFKASFVQGWS